MLNQFFDGIAVPHTFEKRRAIIQHEFQVRELLFKVLFFQCPLYGKKKCVLVQVLSLAKQKPADLLQIIQPPDLVGEKRRLHNGSVRKP